MTANIPSGANAFPTRGSAAGAEPWEQVDQLEEMAWRAEAEEAARQLEAAVLRTRRRLEGERRRGSSRRRSRR